MFSPPLSFPGAGYLSPFGYLPRTCRVCAKWKSKVFEKTFEHSKMRPPAKRGRAQRKCKQYLDVLTIHTHSRNSPSVGNGFF